MAPKRKRRDMVREARDSAMRMGLPDSPNLVELIYGITSETLAYPKTPPADEDSQQEIAEIQWDSPIASGSSSPQEVEHGQEVAQQNADALSSCDVPEVLNNIK